MNKLLYIYLFATLILSACSSEDIPNETPKGDKQIELKLSVKSFEGESVTRAGFDATPAENQIDNLYLFIQSGATLHKYYIAAPSFTGGSWVQADNKIILALSQAEASTADVYVVANISASTKTTLDAVTSIANLKSTSVTTATPWTSSISTPLIMSGEKLAHNFTTTPILNAIPLYRAVAKVEVEVTLSEQYQSTPTITNPYDPTDIRDQYKYQYLNFNQNTFLLNSTTKSESLVGTAGWTTIGNTNYSTDSSGKVNKLTFTTYLNERASGDPTTINVLLPFWDNGMPPPQFIEDGYPIKLPTKIERNHYYKVNVQM